MTILFYAKLYLMTVPIFFAIDLLWLGVVAKPLYQKHLGEILAPNVHWKAAAAFYLIYIAGILVFAVVPALDKASAGRAVLWGLLFGIFTYATYDLTNMATLPRWPLTIALIDIAWGMTLCAAVAGLSYRVGKWLM
jgi:uncharacterized membrane protein